MNSNTTLEFVRLTPSEQLYANKQFLYSQLGILSLMQRYATFQALRMEELNLKINLKKLIDDTKTALKQLETTLPKVETANPGKKEIFNKDEIHSLKAEERVLEREIEEIKRRLMNLG